MNLDIIYKSRALLSSKIIPRTSYYDKLQLYLHTQQIVVIQGQRRVGKSSIALGYLQDQNIPMEQIFFLNKELDVQDSIRTAKELDQLFQLYLKEVGEPTHIVIDEIQDIQEREKFIRAIYALKKYHIIITGSNSHLLSGELATYLSGRYLAFEVFPLGYDEYLTFTHQEKNAETFRSYSYSGGMPEVVKIDTAIGKKQYLEGLMNTIFVNDIVKRYDIKDVSYLEQLFMYLADIIGSEMSIKNIHTSSQQYGWGESASLIKLSNYLQMLQSPYLIHKVPRYDIHGKKILEHNEKYYFNDIGLRNSIHINEDLDKAKLLENIVFLHLKRLGYKVYVGKYKEKEIDFIAQKGSDIQYFQVTWMLTAEHTQKREFENLLLIEDAYPKHVVSMDMVFEGNYQGIRRSNILDFLTT